jgi:16S rRNA (uracil1498-N3)-methyltransferase
VSDVTGGGLEVEATGAVSREPAPGEPGASIPWIELAVALPREKRAEVMLDRLVQLGLAALTPLWTGRSQGPRRDLSASRRRRLERAAREACKQSGRTWLPVLNPTHSPDELAASREGTSVALLSPDEGMVLPHWAGRLDEGLGTRLEPIVLVVGPEGGFTDDEARRLTEGGARRVRLGPHTLRVETAAEAAVGGLVQTLFRP